MANGLTITEKDFMSMKQKEQNLILFRNLNEIKTSIRTYKLFYRLTTIIGGVLASGMGYLFIIHLR